MNNIYDLFIELFVRRRKFDRIELFLNTITIQEYNNIDKIIEFQKALLPILSEIKEQHNSYENNKNITINIDKIKSKNQNIIKISNIFNDNINKHYSNLHLDKYEFFKDNQINNLLIVLNTYIDFQKQFNDNKIFNDVKIYLYHNIFKKLLKNGLIYNNIHSCFILNGLGPIISLIHENNLLFNDYNFIKERVDEYRNLSCDKRIELLIKEIQFLISNLTIENYYLLIGIIHGLTCIIYVILTNMYIKEDTLSLIVNNPITKQIYHSYLSYYIMLLIYNTIKTNKYTKSFIVNWIYDFKTVDELEEEFNDNPDDNYVFGIYSIKEFTDRILSKINNNVYSSRIELKNINCDFGFILPKDYFKKLYDYTDGIIADKDNLKTSSILKKILNTIEINDHYIKILYYNNVVIYTYNYEYIKDKISNNMFVIKLYKLDSDYIDPNEYKLGISGVPLCYCTHIINYYNNNNDLYCFNDNTTSVVGEKNIDKINNIYYDEFYKHKLNDSLIVNSEYLKTGIPCLNKKQGINCFIGGMKKNIMILIIMLFIIIIIVLISHKFIKNLNLKLFINN